MLFRIIIEHMSRSASLFNEAKVIPGGVNSPVRAFKGRWHTTIYRKS